MRILVINGLTNEGTDFILNLPKEDWVVIIDDFGSINSGKNLMKMLMARKLKFYKGMKKIEFIKKREGIEKVYEF